MIVQYVLLTWKRERAVPAVCRSDVLFDAFVRLTLRMRIYIDIHIYIYANENPVYFWQIKKTKGKNHSLVRQHSSHFIVPINVCVCVCLCASIK